MKLNILYPLRKLHGTIHDYNLLLQQKKQLRSYYKNSFLSKAKINSKTVFLILTPEHTNLGDHAIAFSEIELLRQHGFDYVEITGRELEKLQKYNLLGIMNGHPIIVNGGGNLGTLWYDVEQITRSVISSNPKSHIYILPNTIYYEDSEWGRAEFDASKQLYNQHKHLYLYAREKISYQIMSHAYRNVKLVPDMVLRLNQASPQIPRKGCLLCLRNDCERTISDLDMAHLSNILHSIFKEDISMTDMHSPANIPIEKRTSALNQKYTEFRKSSLVVTDRLHGMIFCAITATPCIVINSKSPKIKGCYEWLRHLEYIRFCDDLATLSTLISTAMSVNPRYDHTIYSAYYKELLKDISAAFGS